MFTQTIKLTAAAISGGAAGSLTAYLLKELGERRATIVINDINGVKHICQGPSLKIERSLVGKVVFAVGAAAISGAVCVAVSNSVKKELDDIEEVTKELIKELRDDTETIFKNAQKEKETAEQCV